ncbi:MAG: YvcK family protein [Candidatus Gastranaerophilales bacterium]|nr:YvcK family protein [Candidatus Gastranaerophilales bacterium]
MKNKYKSVSELATWLIPGLQIKRWFFLLFLGTLCVILGTAIILNLHPVQLSMKFLITIAQITPSSLTGSFVIGFGLLLFYVGWKRSNSSLLDAFGPRDREHLLEILYRRRKLNRGPKIVAIGGGTGLSTLLRGIKHITNNVTAIVTVGDDGGSSGRLRQELGVLPPGDIRNCIAALASEEDLVTKLFQYRFKTGQGLEGHSFGNLFLSALCAITGDMESAVKESSKVLAIRGKVLPATLDDMRLVAELDDGRIIFGESNIPEACGKIKKLKTEPTNLRALEDAVDAINEADLIILGPGSLYTSVIPNLLVNGIVEAIESSSAKKVYICNIMTQPGETDNLSVSDHVKAILIHAKHKNIIDTVFVNDTLPKNLAKKYELAGSYPVKLDIDEVNSFGIHVIAKTLIENNKDGFVRHSPSRLARHIYRWYRKNEFKEDDFEKLEKDYQYI